MAAADLVLKDDELAALSEAATAFRPVGGAKAAASMLRERLRS